MMAALGIGSTVWLEQSWRGHRELREAVICGETRVSWIIGEADNRWTQSRFPKKADSFGRRYAKHGSGQSERVAISREEMDGWRYITTNRADIMRSVGRCEDPAILRQVAALVGYKEQDAKP